MRFRRGYEPTHDVPLHDDETTVPVDVNPLKREQLAGAKAGPQRAQEPGVPPREVLARDRQEAFGLVGPERVDLGRRLVAATKVTSQPQRRVRLELLVFDSLRQQRTQGAR